MRDRFGYPARGRAPHSEVVDDVTSLRKENIGLRAAITEMRPVFDRSVRAATVGKTNEREWARRVQGMIAAGEFGEPRHLL